MLAYKGQIDRAYAGEGAASVDDFRMMIDGFFVACEHLKDWLIHDLGLSLTGKDDDLVDDRETEKRRIARVHGFANDSLPLSVADAYANVWKHHTRSGEKMPWAWINSITEGPSGMSAEIWYYLPGKKGYEPFDAAELARDCVKAWQKFIWRD